MIHTVIIMIAARMSENVIFKILTVVLRGIHVFWDSSCNHGVLRMLEADGSMFLQNAKNHIPVTQCCIPDDLNPFVREDCLD